MTGSALSLTFRIGCLLALLLLCGCGRDEETAPATKPLVLVISGDTSGRIIPCGCTSNQSGGLPRRGSYLKELRESQTVVYLDAGGAASGTSPYDRMKFEAVLKAESLLEVAAHNIGEAEAKFGAETLRDIGKKLSVPFISANLRDEKGELIADPLKVVEAEGQRLAVIGVLSPRYATQEFQIDPSDQAVLAAIGELKEPADSVIVLAYLPEEELLELAKKLPEADLVIGGPTGQNIPPKNVGPTVVASATNQGKFVAEFRAESNGSKTRWQGSLIEMTGTYADDPDQTQNLKEFYGRLEVADFSPAETSFVSALASVAPLEFHLAGTASCRDCHDEECKTWDKSRHAKAWDSLTHTGAHVDADCQRCHVTGFGLPGGFVSVKRTPEHQNIGCESCHGPSRAHADNPELPTAYTKQAANQCLKCHDPENSPQFDYASYWPHIQHGPTTTAKDTP